MNKKRIMAILDKYGVPDHITGYLNLVDALDLIMKERPRNLVMHKGLYPKVAEITGSTPVAIERSIRYAIETSAPEVSNLTNKKFLTAIYHELIAEEEEE